jgi:cytochrome c7-like protein
MISRRQWALVPGFVAIAVAVALLSAYSGASSSQGFGPDQPIAFPHPVHVKELGLNCVYCHFAAFKSPDPGMPAVGTCLGCHNLSGIGPSRPPVAARPGVPARAARQSTEIKKLMDTYSVGGTNVAKAPIPWVRIHKVPDYVHFPHMRHVSAGVTCQTCHGDIQNMSKVYQYASLNMGWCVSCHVNGYKPADGMRLAGLTPTPQDVAAEPKRARYDCAICHY